jgi:putative transposase
LTSISRSILILEKSPPYPSHSLRVEWGTRYGAFSVSESRREAVLAYIARQEEHHRKWSFEDEFLTLVRQYGVSFDPQTVFG